MLVRCPFAIILQDKTNIPRIKHIAPEIEHSNLLRRYKAAVDSRLRAVSGAREPKAVYEPFRYALLSGGKRLRAVIVLLACEAAGGKWKSALDAAAAIEMLHNFTLVHDDIMDDSVLRRGKPTVHAKWDVTTAVLSGDEMIARAYGVLLRTSTSRSNEIARVFTNAFVEVCEGQGFDIEFERRPGVTVDDYLMMIGKKTAFLFSAAAEIGALIGNATARRTSALRSYGAHLGIAFQLQDDLLDVDGTREEFGKTIGGDIEQGKKTFLLLSALERLKGAELKEMKTILHRNGTPKISVERAREIYSRAGIFDSARKEILRNTHHARKALASLPATPARAALGWLADRLADRNS